LCRLSILFAKCHPVPGQQFVESIDLVIVDAVEDIGEVGLRIEAIHFCGFDDGHGAGERFSACIGASEQPVASADADRPQGAFCGVVVDGNATIGQEQREGWPAAEPVAERLGQIALARNAGQLFFGPGVEGLDLGFARVKRESW